jgi:anaerobic magnesium-protoporphyrin IX monomethyl ester cyclase
MQALLINPRYDETHYRYRVNKLCPPLGMGYIASMLLNEGHSVKILDMEAERMEYEALPGWLASRPFDVVGIHGTTPISHFIARCVDIVKTILPNVTLILGGPHASLLPESVFENMPGVDYILRGEAEYTICDLMSRLQRGATKSDLADIPGICFRKGDSLFLSPEIPLIEDLDNLPFPAYDLFPLDSYFYKNRLVETGAEERIFTIMSSRGCPNGCIFCCESSLYGRKFRARSAENVVDEMTVLANRYGVGHIVIYDASFMVDRARVERICDEIIGRSLKVSWRARVRADQVDEPLIMKMKSAGCSTLAIGVESGSQRLLDIMGKNCRIRDIENAFRIIKDAGLWTVGYFMFGTPGETREESLQTIEFAKKLDPDWALFTHATPLPGTRLYEMTKEKMLTDDWSRFKFSANSPIVSYDSMSEREMRDMMDYAFQSFYVRKEWLANRLKKVQSEAQVERILDSFFYYVEKSRSSKSAT